MLEFHFNQTVEVTPISQYFFPTLGRKSGTWTVNVYHCVGSFAHWQVCPPYKTTMMAVAFITPANVLCRVTSNSVGEVTPEIDQR